MSYRNMVVFSIALLALSCNSSTQPILSVPLIETEIKVDGIIGQNEWQQAIVIEKLHSPWDKNGIDATNFKAFVTDDYFNFCFTVVDTTLITVPFEKELSVDLEDRVELFFSADTTLEKYHCIEIDPNGNVLDYSAKNYRIFNYDWNFKSKKIITQITDTGYIVEGKISIKELKELGIENPFYLGVFRADFKSFQPDDVIWFSWIKPSSSQPDFHIPSSFGKVTLKQ